MDNNTSDAAFKLMQNTLGAWFKAQSGCYEYIAKQLSLSDASDMLCMEEASEAFTKLINELVSRSETIADIHSLFLRYTKLFYDLSAYQLNDGFKERAVVDNRFKNDIWTEHAFFNFVKQSYQLHADWMLSLIEKSQTLTQEQKEIARFWMKQYVDSICPANFLWTNPVALKEMLETNGNSIFDGVTNFIEDVQKSVNVPYISTCDLKAFEIGKNIAATAGKVVFQNSLMQLIQYSPSTEKVNKTPILIIPAWINKYYILDLQQDHSFVKWVVDQGFTVFMISWINPTAELRDKSYINYMHEGSIAAIEEVKKLTGEKQVHCVGYCLGGTLLATTVAYLEAKKKNCIASATFLATLVDFQESGDIGVFISEKQIAVIEKNMEVGYFDGRKMAYTFSMLRPNDMIWSFYVNNYLRGKKPAAFDVLYWNADSTNLPAAMHSYYLRNMYLKNALVQDKIVLDNIPIKLSSINVPTYILATKEDHIAPWTSVFKACNIYNQQNKGNNNRFILSASGHVVGVINHPSKNKYCYWHNESKSQCPEQWLSSAHKVDGSWWPDWAVWLNRNSDAKIDARAIDENKVIENAPGSYVHRRI